MILTPKLQDIINSFLANIQATIPDLSTTPISVTREALINPASSQIASLFDLAQTISTIQDISQATGTDLDTLGNSFGLTRRAGTVANGILYLDLTQLNSNVSTITVNNGTVVFARRSGNTLTSTTFAIVGNFTFSATNRATYEATAAGIRAQLDSVGLTGVTLATAVPIQSNTTGAQGNVGAFTLTSANITNINIVINTSPTSGGSDAESDTLFRSRIIGLFTGNSVGTATSLTAAATTPTSITGAFLVGYGDPLMTRDGSVYDANGNVITAGTGRDVDIYVQGTNLSTNTENNTFTLNDITNFLSIDNSILVGQPSSGNLFGSLPIASISTMQGNESGAVFTQGVPVADVEGNIIIEGNFALIPDINAGSYSIVENLTTKERKLATFVNPSSTVYTMLQKLAPSDFANSPFSHDRVLFLKDTVDISNEIATKGTYNGADQLQYTNVASINQISSNLTITDTIRIQNFTSVPGGVSITLPHTPVVSVTSVYDTRLGTNLNFQLLDPATGSLQLTGRFPPRSGDLVVVTYVWQNIYQEDLNYTLLGDSVSWVAFADQQTRTDSTLLPSSSLEAQTVLALQPDIPSRLQLQMDSLADREVISTIIAGTTTALVSQQLALKSSNPYTFAATGLASIGRIFEVLNTSQGFSYNLTGYSLFNNKLDPRAVVDTSLLTQQFSLSANANLNLVSPGDYISLSLPSKFLSWSSQSDFQNNIEGNLAPIYDPTQIEFTPGGVVLTTPLLDKTTAVVSLSGAITQDTTLSGIIEIIGDLIINEGVVVDIEPNTLIKMVPSSNLSNQSIFAQSIIFDGYIMQQETVGTIDGYTGAYSLPPLTQYSEFFYYYIKPANYSSSYFTIINDLGQTLSITFEKDILTKVINGSTISFLVAGRAVNPSFNFDIETTIDLLNVTSSIKATFLGATYGQNGLPIYTAALIPTLNRYYILLNRTPITTTSPQTDFTLTVTTDTSITFPRFAYDSTLKALAVEGDILVIDGYGDTTTATDYILTYFITTDTRLSITVDGTLRILGATPQTSVLFTSEGNPAAPGDWEGIVFTAKSHSSNPRTVFQSNLQYARIMYANVGISAAASDVNIQNCVIRDCLAVGINISSTNKSVSQYTQNGFNLTQLGDPLVEFTPTSRLGFKSADGVQIARYFIPDNMVASGNVLPVLGVQLTPTSYVVNFTEGVDYIVYIQGQRAIGIDTTLPSDGYTDYSLVPGSDYMIEYDVNNGYSLVFLYTANTTKLRNVYNLVNQLEQTQRTGPITIDYFSSIANGIVYDNLIINANAGIVLNSLATTSINRNTIDNVKLGIVSSQSIVSIMNNLITGFSVAPISTDARSLIRAQRNNMYSQILVNQDQTGILDTDILLRSITALTITLLVRTPAKFTVGAIITIDSEDMLVQGVTDDSVVVARGQNNTTFAAHQAGARVTILQLNQIFIVSGINGDNCQLLETDSFGIVKTNAIPIQMRLVSPNTFKTALPINRRADFYYKYQYSYRSSTIVYTTLLKVFPRIQPGIGMNDLITVPHEIPLNSVLFTPNNENFSTDPLYTNVPAADYSFPALTSPASSQAAIYGSLSAPNPLHRFVGYLNVSLSRTLPLSITRIPAPYPPLIVSSFTEVSIVGTDALTSGIILTANQFSYNITTAEANQGAVGVFILDSAAFPTGVVVSGEYQVQYKRPIDLGTDMPPYYIQSTISYVVDAGSEVTFENLVFNKDALGGEIDFTFQVAASVSNLQAAAISTTTSASPILIDQVATTAIGRAIQINITLKGNDSSFTPSLVFQFPILLDFTLSYSPAQDIQQYVVLSLLRNKVLNDTNILLNMPITTNTFNVVGTNPVVEVIVRRKADNYDPSLEYILCLAKGVSAGNTFVTAYGDLTTAKPDALSTDIIKVTYLSYQAGTETLYFTQDGAQITTHAYSDVSSILSTITVNTVSTLPSTETIEIHSLTQPTSSDTYNASYAFEAPLDGEALTISYVYNRAIVDSSAQVETKKSIFTNVLVKQVTQVPVRIALALVVDSTASPLSVQAQVSAAISNLFTTTLVDITTERQLTTDELVRATGTISGIASIAVTTLSRNLISGEIVSPLIFERRESPVLEASSPRINTTQNGTSK